VPGLSKLGQHIARLAHPMSAMMSVELTIDRDN
jgi:hypothetical protein